MPIPPHHLDTLEFRKIRELLARHSSFSAGTELALALYPSTDAPEVRLAQDATGEARHLLEVRPNWAPRGAYDIRSLARHAALGGLLPPEELVRLASTLAAARATRNVLERPESHLPTLAAQAERIANQSNLERAIRQAVNDDGQILDSASGRLAAIRIQLRTAHDRLLRRLHQLMASPNVREALQEPILTMRAGRYVIPIKADFRGRVPGIVHDQSASGATVFVEPLAVVDLANDWRSLALQEEHEIERILRDLSAQAGRHADALVEIVEALAQIDLAFAKAKLASEMGAERPLLSAPDENQARQRPVLHLVQARHPLLSGGAVPIDVELGGAFDVLLISGPNTGGKTVALKTVGLLALMAQAGLQIPAAPGSGLPIFSGIYADIGDEQSIEQSLSTFSAHISRIIDILAVADKHSLVLLDEVGAGTDPQEGSALGRALLSHLARAGIPTIATTHSSELKLFAASTPRVQNASVEFDLETLRPTYRLLIGLAGQSNALTIAERLGMDRRLVEEARQFLAPAERHTHALLDEVRGQLTEARRDRVEVARHRAEAEQLAQTLAKKVDALEAERQAVLVGAEEDAARLLNELQVEADALRRELRTLRTGPRQLAPVQARITALAEAQAQRTSTQAPGPPPLTVGDPVEVGPLASIGLLRSLSDDGQTAEVEVRGMRVRVPLAHLRPSHRPPRDSADPTWPAVQEENWKRMQTHRDIESEIDLRGLTAEEARQRLDQYLSDAVVAGVGTLRVVHGKGTGVLREAVRELLAEHPLVRAHRSAEAREGGEGATLAELAV